MDDQLQDGHGVTRYSAQQDVQRRYLEYGRERNDDDCGSEDVKKFVYVLVL